MLVKVNRVAASALLTLVLLLGFAPVSQAQLGISRPKGQVLLDGIVVKVDNQIVLRSEVELIYAQEVARAEGKAKPLAQKMSGGEFLIAAATAVIPALAIAALHWLTWTTLIAGVVFAAIATIWLARKFVRRIGGYTGDCLGAVQQVSEVMFYLCALGALRA